MAQKLADVARRSQKPDSSPASLGAALAGARVFHPFVIPRLNVAAVMTLVGTARIQQIEGRVWADMKALGIDFNGATEAHYELRRAAYVLAEAVLMPSRLPFDDGAEFWLDADPDLVADCYRVYRDVKEANDPVGRELTDDEYEVIAAAVKKKQPILLRFIGSRMLSSWLLCTDDQRSNSPQRTFGSTQSSPESAPLTPVEPNAE